MTAISSLRLTLKILRDTALLQFPRRSIDNRPMEGYRGIIKSEMYYLKKFTSKENLIDTIDAYIVYYNTQRYRFRLKCMTPIE